jgi:hypothetical protein
MRPGLTILSRSRHSCVKNECIPLDIDRLFVFWLFHCATSGNFIAKITCSFHDSVLGDLARARNRAGRITGRYPVLLTLYSSTHDQNLAKDDAVRRNALYAPAEFNKLNSETDYLEKTFQITTPASAANTRLIPNT